MASSLSYGVNNNNVVQPRLHRVINSTQECIGGPSRSGTPSKGALKAYPSAKPLSKHSISSLALSSYRNPDDIYSEKQSKMIKKSKTSIVGKRSMDCDHKKSTSLNEAPLSNNSLESTVTNSLSNSDSPRSLASNDIPVSCKTEIEAFESLPNTPVDSTNQCDSTFISHESRKRILHLYAEKNRRTALKDGFEQLLTILPNLHNNGGKNTNAVVLAKSAEYIRDLKIRTESKEQEVSAIKAKIDEMNEKINHYHSNLPSTSNQSNCNVNSRLSFEHFFERHAKTKSKEDWHFWLMWKLMKNSIDTYSSTIPEGPLSKTETIDNCKKWLMENFDALHLRPSASQLLLFLATEANFMNDAESLPKFISADIDKR
uniref:BHLH domain-containing protein n=1 Tax=Rhabditophanes sp. KR3021 TaxID=114890 RepID=A0AC35U9G3_9BILA